MISDWLQTILREYANADTDIDELAGMLNRTDPPGWRATFHDDLSVALRGGDLTPDVADDVMLRDFDDQHVLDAWLQEAWAAWFPGEDYPG